MYIIIDIGCLCCDTQSNLVQVVNTYEEAEYIENCLNSVYNGKHRYQVFDITNAENMNEYYKNIFNDGKIIYKNFFYKI